MVIVLEVKVLLLLNKSRMLILSHWGRLHFSIWLVWCKPFNSFSCLSEFGKILIIIFMHYLILTLLHQLSSIVAECSYPFDVIMCHLLYNQLPFIRVMHQCSIFDFLEASEWFCVGKRLNITILSLTWWWSKRSHTGHSQVQMVFKRIQM